MAKPGRQSRSMSCGPRLLNVQLPAAPPSTACRVLARSSPPAEAKRKASPRASMLFTTRIWFTSLTICPAPWSPTWVMAWPMASRTGRARSNCSASPPTMMLSVPRAAPSLPPLTGASSMWAPFSASFPAMAWVWMGLMVLQSMTSAPSRRPWMAPSGPNRTSSTSGVSLTQTTITSHRAASSAGLPAARAPLSTNGSILAAVRFQTARS